MATILVEPGGQDTDNRQWAGRLVEPEALICPGCGEQVRCTPPTYPRVGDAAVPQFCHRDTSPLCPTRSGAATEPVEALPGDAG